MSDDKHIVGQCFVLITWSEWGKITTFLQEHPSVVRMFGRHCLKEDNPGCEAICTPLGYAISRGISTHSAISFELFQLTDINETCWIDKTVRYDALSLCVHWGRSITYVLSRKPSIHSLESAIDLCHREIDRLKGDAMDRSDESRVCALVARLFTMEKHLELERGIYAVFWAFHEGNVHGEHGGIFETLEGVWRVMPFTTN